MTTTAVTPIRINASDMVTGVLAVLSRRGVTSIYTKGPAMDRALFATATRLGELAGEYALNVRFAVQAEDSPTLAAALSSFAARGLGGYHNWDLELRAVRLRLVDLDGLPGGCGLYEELATTFIDAYGA